MPMETWESGFSVETVGLGEWGAVRGRKEDTGYFEAGVRVEPRTGRRRSDSVMDLERPGIGDGGVPKLGERIVVEGTRFRSSHPDREDQGSALADSDVNDDCESAKRLLPPCAEDGDVTGLDWGELMARMGSGVLSGMSVCRDTNLRNE
jgi:hypothetical protein